MPHQLGDSVWKESEPEIIAGLYRVDTQATPVELSFGSASRVRGEMFLRPSIVTADGVESIADRMNDRDAFFPLRVAEPTPGTLLVGKTQVRYVCAEDPPVPTALIAGGAVQLTMTLELDDGELLSGVFFAVMPPGKRRALDFINRDDGLFVPFFSEQRQYVVNRSFIRSVIDRTPEG